MKPLIAVCLYSSGAALIAFELGRHMQPANDVVGAPDMSVHPSSSDTSDRIIWDNTLLSRMRWVPTSGSGESSPGKDSSEVIKAGLDDSGLWRSRWADLSLIRLHGEMGWACSGCGYVLNDAYSKVSILASGTEYVAQARTPDGLLVGWMTTDTVTRWSFNFFIDREFQRHSDSSTKAFYERINRGGSAIVRLRESGAPEPKNRKWVLRETDRMGQFRHFSTKVVDLDQQEHLLRVGKSSTDSVRFAKIVDTTPARRISPEELDVLGLAANIGITSKSCYRRISNGDISFRTRRTGSWRVTSAWNPQGKPVAWNALDTASGFQFPIWFHLDRQACLEQTDSVVPRTSLFRRIFHLQ